MPPKSHRFMTAESWHFFVNVAMPILGDVPSSLLVEVSQLARANGTMSDYPPLVSAMQKLQWVKIACETAIKIDAELSKKADVGFLPAAPVGRAQHAMSIFEIVAYGKATTDAISHFLNVKWRLGLKKGACDLKWQDFRDRASEVNNDLRDFLISHRAWLDKDARNTESLPAARDEWIHRSFPHIALVWPPAEIGALPVPKSLDHRMQIPPLDRLHDEFWSTPEFARMHWGNLVSILLLVLHAAVGVERRTSPELKITHDGGPLASLFQILMTRGMSMKGYAVGPLATNLIEPMDIGE